MAIFNSNDGKPQDKNTNTSTTIITIGSTIKGEMNLECNLFVDGAFEGTIHSSKEVTIGKNGKIKGDLYAKKLIVQGEMSGNVISDTVAIKPQGKVSGTVESQELIIESKGLFEGKSIIKKAQADSFKTEKVKS
jgi:cytoskeletal protein CcmA (bactofilin family)